MAGLNNSALLRQSSEQFYWEDNGSANVGLDLGFFSNRLFLTTDYFIGQLNMGAQYPADNPLAFISELSQRRYYRINYPPNSRILNQGIELEIVYKDRFGDFRSNLGFRVAHTRNKIMEISDYPMSFLYDEDYDVISANIPGHAPGSFYGYKIERLFTAEDCNASGYAVNQPFVYFYDDSIFAQPRAKAGDYKFADTNQDSILDQRDRIILGNPTPDLVFGFDWQLEYKNIDPGNTDTDLHRVDSKNKNQNLRISDFSNFYNVLEFNPVADIRHYHYNRLLFDLLCFVVISVVVA